MPNVGTGYVDWGQYVNANQPTIDRDRKLVQDYMQNQDQQARKVASATFSDKGYQGGPNYQGADDPWNQWINQLQTNQSALQSPEGFSQVLAQAKANYDPTSKDAQGKPAKAPQAMYDPFDSALEGTNAGALYHGADDVQKFAEGMGPQTASTGNGGGKQPGPATPPVVEGPDNQPVEGGGPPIKPGRRPTKPVGSP